MTHDLSITLKTPDNRPLANAVVTVTPERVNPVQSGTVLSTATGTTDVNGHLVLSLLPSTTNRFYIMRIKVENEDIIAPYRFAMPATDTTLTNLLQATFRAGEPIPTGIAVTVQSAFTNSDRLKLDGIALMATNTRELSDLSDVSVTSPTAGQTLIYDDTDNEFKNQSVPPPPNITLADLPAISTDDLSDVTLTSVNGGDILAWDQTRQQWVNIQRHEYQLVGDNVVRVLSLQPPSKRLDKSVLKGDTVLTGGSALPAPDDVRNWQLFVIQDSTADNPALYLTSAQFDIPYTQRNYFIVTPNNRGHYRLDPPEGSARDNFQNRLGAFSAIVSSPTVSVVLLAIYFADASVSPATIWVRGISGSPGGGFALAKDATRPAFIGGREYVQYRTNLGPNAFSGVNNVEQELRLYTDANAQTPFNVKPVADHHARAWHLQSPVQPDWGIADPQSPAFIKRKPTIPTIPTPTSIGGVVATTGTLPTTATTFSRRGTTNVSIFVPTLTAGAVTTGYSVSANTVVSAQPHPQAQIGWYARVVTGTTEVCRVFIPLTATITYASLGSIVDTQRVVSHALMGTYNNYNIYLAYQASMGGQTRPGQSGTTGHDIELFLASPQQPVTVNFPASTRVELVEAVVG